LTGSSEAIVVRIYGPDLKVLREKAHELAEAIGGVDGAVDAHASLQTSVPHILVEPDVEAARRVGLTPGDIRRQSSTMVASEEVSDIFHGGRVYDVNVTAMPSARDSVTDVENMQIDIPGGSRVRLKDVARVTLAGTPNAIERENQSRRIDVGANISGGDLGGVVDRVEDLVAGMDFPRGYYAEVVGESNELTASHNQLLLFGLVAGIAILLLLHAAFGSFRLALITFLALPAAMAGGVLAVWLGDGILSLGALVGFLTVFGIAARNGILMISHFQHLERYEGQEFGSELVLRGAQERLAPIMMTALATALALVPLAVAGSIPGHEIEHPMAIVILGGLVTATLLNLFVLPSLYLRFGRHPRMAHPRRPKPDDAGRLAPADAAK
jgi:Cu/Ag efflux pump CusA